MTSFNFEKPEFIINNNVENKTQANNLFPEYWLKIADKLAQESGKNLDRINLRSGLLLNTFDLPLELYNSLEKPKGKETEEEIKERLKRDEIINTKLVNKEGVWIDKKRNIFSLDFRDMYPDGLPEDLKNVLDPRTKRIMEIEYEHRKFVQDNHSFLLSFLFLDTQDNLMKADQAIHYFRLPGGIDLFLKSYVHHEDWQKIHGKFLKEINREAEIISLESYLKYPFGNSLSIRWLSKYDGSYNILMKEAVAAGFSGLFTEVDMRNVSHVQMDSTIKNDFQFFPDLPDEFFSKYFEYLKRENPSLINHIKSPDKLKKILRALSTSSDGTFFRSKDKDSMGTKYYNFPYISETGKVSFEPTYLELGQHLFSDALASIKLHLIGKLMADGYLKKGPIIDYEGGAHLPSKTFFLKYPRYAMEVVLRTVNELMAEKSKNLTDIYHILEQPDWELITKEIFRLTFKKVENNKLIDVSPDVFTLYHVDPKQVIPSDEQIDKIIEQINNNNTLKAE